MYKQVSAGFLATMVFAWTNVGRVDVARADVVMKAGVARVKLTPPASLKASLGGYGERMSKPAVGVHDHVYAKAIVLTGGGKKFALVTIDILGIPPSVKGLVLERVADRGFTVENVMLLPSHSHSSIEMSAINPNNHLDVPQIGIFQPKLMEHTVAVLAKVITQADESPVPVRIGTATAQVRGHNRNRRGDKINDPQLVVTRVDTSDGKPLAILVNWTAHPTFMGARDMYFSGGWPGYLQRELEALIGVDVTAMYYNGAEGDQSPTPTRAEAASSHERAERYGRSIALHAWDVYKKAKTKSRVAFAFNRKIILLPKPRAHEQIMKSGGEEYGFTDEVMKGLLTQVCPRQTESTALRLGDLLIVGVPGELICSLGLKIKEQLRRRGAKIPVIGGLANEWVSYILSPNEYDQGGYEASVSFYGRTLGPVIVKGVLATAQPLANKHSAK